MGLFITIEGPNGVGKTTFIKKIAECLEKMYSVVITREPTDTEFGIYVRNNEGKLKGNAYAYLIAADRCNHLEGIIEPALNENKVVICDRYIESSLVLQAFDGVKLEDIWRLNSKFRVPDISIILIAKEETLSKRLSEREKLTDFEKRMTRDNEIKGYIYANEFLKNQDFNMMLLYNETERDLEINIQKVLDMISKLEEKGQDAK